MDRTDMLERIRDRSDPWDFVVVGGGATGAGVAVIGAVMGSDDPSDAVRRLLRASKG